jgi:hypothetical protein
MYSADDILDCAYDIKPLLPRLLVDGAAGIVEQLEALLLRQELGEQVDLLIVQLLSQYPPAKDWARRYLTGDQDVHWTDRERGYSPLPGQTQEVPATTGRLFCPTCGYRWMRRQVGQQPPSVCPNDKKTPLQPVSIRRRGQNAG